MSSARSSLIVAFAVLFLLPAISRAQDPAPGTGLPPTAAPIQDPSSEPAPDEPHKHILGIIPNYRTAPLPVPYVPLRAKEKFNVAIDDATDRGTFALAALFAGEAQWTKAEPSFGRGVPAYARYYGASLADWVVGDVMTEGVYPTILHQDPRYFRRGHGNGWARLGYAVGQIFRTHSDSGGMQVNVSEIVGNATAAAIANAYYPDNRTLSANASKLGIQIAVDMVSNILKEFSPDLDRALSRHPPPPDGTSGHTPRP